MTARRGRIMSDLYPTGPIDFQDDDALKADPYVRDLAGKFAVHEADKPRKPKRRKPAQPEHVTVYDLNTDPDITRTVLYGGAVVIYSRGTNFVPVHAPTTKWKARTR